MTRNTATETAWRQHEDFFTAGDGTRIGFSDTRNRAAPTTVLFLHGWTQNREAWDDVAGPLHKHNPELRIVALDHRGHGKSDPAPGGSVNVRQLATDAADFINAEIPTGQIVIVGHSMGGMTMMGLGEYHQDLVAQRISGAVFVATSAGRLLHRLRVVPPVFSVVKAVVLGVVAQGWFLQQGYLMRPIISTLVFGRDPRPYDVSRVWDQIRSGTPRSYKDAAESMVLHEDLTEGLSAYRGMPSAVLAGARDFLTPAGDSRIIAAALQTNELRTYPGSGHMLPNERAGEVINEIVTVLDALAQQPATPAARESTG
ncbi:alpha/beta fold hydrolase [Mycobacteroides immunogenum]|uniref:Alpha/beta hydrolase n=1 Tax=Mycobacteroides immunogenum TaxID=83262 RepID=A0A7V8RYX4_9MYCO|nr:alpha/beta hydrolase [Mycobacteroides immunogenum]AMT72957.1 alpha/beta hydrolase [Mycobacteroides immunogenum]ANO06121.1 alpha/beta hydrolase [Mycobacteroides immunogenum]KIU41894.1 alpha/beta hydrolase [Mycobacteroides immunogenum]KPG11714.1 alpha/beta hydrolase [Mycobacteroides immunogenum]KPG11798.1 alpha/beta hydrolase [Mycobacteroides immunogenum]